MDKKKKKTVAYESPTLITQKIYLEQVIAASTPPTDDGSITEDWNNDYIFDETFDL